MTRMEEVRKKERTRRKCSLPRLTSDTAKDEMFTSKRSRKMTKERVAQMRKEERFPQKKKRIKKMTKMRRHAE